MLATTTAVAVISEMPCARVVLIGDDGYALGGVASTLLLKQGLQGTKSGAAPGTGLQIRNMSGRTILGMRTKC
jgi:hypothetical protein